MIKKGDSSITEDVSILLFDQAQILEGKTPEELITFSQRLTRVMQSCLTSKT
jgi:HSP90 family molecular chaperone